MDSKARQCQHQKPADLEKALSYLESQLGPLNQQMTEKSPLSDKPMLFIVGSPRSGTTLTYQYLSFSGLFTFPTNFISRFYYAPLLGAKLQQMLYEFDFRGEMSSNGTTPNSFESMLGKTSGPFSPHEFWYFWRRFFQFTNDQATFESEPNAKECFRELKAMQSVHDRPLVMKAMNLNWHLPLLANAYNNAFFLFVHRELEPNARSLVKARKEFFDDESQWYSFKPPGFESILERSPIEQTRWQVTQTNKGVLDGFESMDSNRTFSIQLDEFRAAPKQLLNAICDRWQIEMPNLKHLPDHFSDR